jgi:hypothetical protein
VKREGPGGHPPALLFGTHQILLERRAVARRERHEIRRKLCPDFKPRPGIERVSARSDVALTVRKNPFLEVTRLVFGADPCVTDFHRHIQSRVVSSGYSSRSDKSNFVLRNQFSELKCAEFVRCSEIAGQFEVTIVLSNRPLTPLSRWLNDAMSNRALIRHRTRKRYRRGICS